MLYITETIAGKDYKLRLGAQNCVDVEKKLGKSVLDVLLAMAPNEEGGSVKGIAAARINEICIILQGAMQRYQHGITLENVFDLYDEHIDQGGTYEDFIKYINDVLEVSGFLSKTAEETQDSKADSPVPEA